jgi:hypothetical protein
MDGTTNPERRQMKSTVIDHLQPEFEPVALVWSDHLPDEALQFKKGRFGCILHLLAEASRRGCTASGSRETIACPGGRAALGFGVDFVESEDQLDHAAAIFSKGLESARNREAHRERMESVRPTWRPLYEFGERRHCSFDVAREWISSCLPRYDIPHRYVLFKPLREADPDEDIRSVTFIVDTVELAGLITLLGSVVEGADPVHVPQGADCFRIGCFAYDQYGAESPRAVLGMLDVDGREIMHRKFHDDTVSLTIPRPLFELMEREAGDSILQLPGWRKLHSRRPPSVAKKRIGG